MENKKDPANKSAQETYEVADEEVEEHCQADGETEVQAQKRSAKLDLYSSIVLFLASLYVFVCGLRMPINVYTGSDDAWYGAPGGFPIIIGGILMVLSAMLFVKSWRVVGGFHKEDFKGFTQTLKSSYAKRLVLVVGLLVIYIFVLLGRMPFYVATFLYLFITMLAFRKKNFAIWKLLIICVVVVALITYGFGTLAGIPLP